VRGLQLALGVSLTLQSSTSLAQGLDVLGREAARLGPVAGPGIVVAAPLVSDEPGSSNGLVTHLAALVASALGPGVVGQPQSDSLAGARSTAGRSKTLVFLRTSIVLGEVRMTAELYPGTPNAWDRIRTPDAGVVRQHAAAAKIDAESRAFLAPLSLERPQVRQFRLDEDDVMAAACGDIDRDGRDEIVLVSRRHVLVGHLDAGGFVPLRTIPWADLTARAAVPLREPLATAIATEGEILVGSTDYGGVSLSADLLRTRSLTGMPVWGGRAPACLTAQASAGAFDGAPIDCAPSRDPKPTVEVPAPRFDSFAAAEVVDPGGNSRAVVAVREPSGRLRMKWGSESGEIQGTFGVEMTVGDIDQDGSPELVTTSSAGDIIKIQSVTAVDAAPRERMQLPTPAPVRAFATCPPSEHGAPALLAIVGRAVWVIQPELLPAEMPRR
jgi:hypothetical protein